MCVHVKQTQFKIEKQTAMMEGFDGNILGHTIPGVSNTIASFKKTVYRMFLLNNVGLLKTNRSRFYIRNLYLNYVVVATLLMLFFSFYIFLYVVQLDDNHVRVLVSCTP